MDDDNEVELLNVSKKFGDTAAVRSVTLEVRRGEFLTMLGPSGCGKTTLLRMIAGFEVPDEGRVILGGRDVTGLPPFRRDVTTVFQHYALFPHMDVFNNVAFGLKRRRVARDQIKTRVRSALEMVRLVGLEGRRPNELSGGQQQRVALARSLILEPKVLLLDEPLAALDLKLRKQMQVELKSLQRRLGISFLYVTHDQQEALVMSDRIVVMNEGRVEQVGRADEIYESPQTEFVAGFIGESNIVEGIVEAVSDEATFVRIGGATVRARTSQVNPGQRVRLMVRPEKIFLSSDGPEAGLTGTIATAVYFGESTQWKIVIGGGQEINVVEQNREPFHSAHDKVGQVVWLGWDVESAIILRG